MQNCDTVLAPILGLFALLGGAIAGVAMAAVCLGAGPIGWLCALFLVPLAFYVGTILGTVAGILAVCVGAVVLVIHLCSGMGLAAPLAVYTAWAAIAVVSLAFVVLPFAGGIITIVRRCRVAR
jgi:hypothetical protein